ncbi:peptide-methionine (S)-S-oxide reductase MsrA [Thermococcus stetteri]|uniref:peptide-methionine (S)-S-oxide reductase MsrA n=1 Tax=Thermococcus stetteri TaxID=49900 RepID=UPI001AE5AD23|nr:peptide-methionine (S)-S-oxide reductase MsrA [Thermococcus stetteri]MBP1912629.1 peptide methionine sulfoxide reductase msrA/msrB [Thermococcus stetteri]
MTGVKTEPGMAVFAGNCFWCMEEAFERLPGVIEAVSGYTGGWVENPTYELVSTGETGHREAVKVIYDPSKISYERLLEVFWRNIDPTDPGGQFADRGDQYRTAIYYLTEEQRELAEESKRRLELSRILDKPIVTEILPAEEFYPAEDYHQGYYFRFETNYKHYKLYSGRVGFIKSVWGKKGHFRLFPERKRYWFGYVKPSDAELKSLLMPLQYRVTQRGDTEEPFNNEYWDNHEEGIYVDIVSGEPLFSSLDKYDSGTGWPSFTKPLEGWAVVEAEECEGFLCGREVRSRFAGSHLGHVFDEPTPTGKRYCINSASLRFIPREELRKYGYTAYEDLFK